MNLHLDGRQQLVVVDNASSDAVEEAANAWRGATTFIRLDENLGFGAANNVGVKHARGEAVVLLNPDTELVDSSLDELAASALQLNALVGPRVLFPDSSIQASASGPEVGIWPWIRAVLPGAWTPRAIVRNTEPYRLEERVQVAWLTGACIAAPRAILERLGPFDPGIHLYGEDLELGLRARRRGIASYFCPEVSRVIHYGGGSSSLVYGSGEGWRPDGTMRWRGVLRRTYGPRSERLGWWALMLNLALRNVAKALLRKDTKRDRSALAAAWRARRFSELPPLRETP